MLVSISMCIPKIGYLLSVDREILNMEFFFHKQCVIYILKILPASNSCCFKVNEVIELEPKWIEYISSFLLLNIFVIVLLPVHGQSVDD